MIYTDNLDHKPAAVELERLPDGTAWLRLYKDIKEVSEETTQNGGSYTSKHWEATCAACKLGADRAGETVKTITAKKADWWTYAEAWEEQPPHDRSAAAGRCGNRAGRHGRADDGRD